MDHLAEVNDVLVRDAIELFEAQIELLVLSLLDPDQAVALAQVTGAHDRAADRIISLAGGYSAENEAASVIRIAGAMLTKTYRRLIDTIEHRRTIVDENGGGPQLHS
jgi:hypothetical protein